MRNVVVCLWIAFVFSWNPLYAQDSVKQVIEKVFYKKKVFEIIFFDYKGSGEWPFRRPDGKFAFIIPDSTFQKLYPDILYQLAIGHAKEGMLHTRTFIKKDQGSVLVNNNFFRDETMRLLVRIEQLQIDKTNALLTFHSTSEFNNKDMKNRYVQIKAILRKKREGWKIRHLSIIDYPWRGYMFPQDESLDSY